MAQTPTFLLAALLATASITLANPYSSPPTLFRRSQQTICPPVTYTSGNGGRKIGIVIDSSSSNTRTDPNDLRIAAGRALNDALISSSEATGGKQADLVTVVDFDYTATVLYKLGDPASAGSSFDKIDAEGGTFISEGIKAAINQLIAPGNDPTADRSAIVVLTDGEDSDTVPLVKQIDRANDEGIHVSFGFLSPYSTSSASQPASVKNAILKTGGMFGQISSAASQQSFISQVLNKGLTNNDTAASTTAYLVAGIKLTDLVKTPGPNKYTYTAQAGEALNFTLTPVSPKGLTLTGIIKDKAGKELGSGSTDLVSNNKAVIAVTAAREEDITLEVTAKNANATGDSLFEVSVKSSFGVANCTLPGSATATSSGAPVATFTGAAGLSKASSGMAGLAGFLAAALFL